MGEGSFFLRGKKSCLFVSLCEEEAGGGGEATPPAIIMQVCSVQVRVAHDSLLLSSCLAPPFSPRLRLETRKQISSREAVVLIVR